VSLNNPQITSYRDTFLLDATHSRRLNNDWPDGSPSNPGTYGWFGGGYVPGASSTVDRIDFANDSPTSASPRGLLSQARGYISATGNASYGWFAGGTAAPGSISTVNRIDYSNDSPTSASVRGPLLIARHALAATGNANYGWFGGGQIPTPNFMASNVERIDYSNDSPTSASPRGFLSLARTEPGATSNANYGWWAGGWFPGSPATYTTIDRVDFSNDSPASASPRNPLLSQTKLGTAGFGNANFGWFAGGDGGGPVSPAASSYVDRIDYSNDSSTAGTSIRGSLIVARSRAAGSANSAFGWVGGGWVPGSRSWVERIDFANDTVSATTRGPLSQTRYGLGGTSNYVKTVPSTLYPTQNSLGTNQPLAGYGWMAGGLTPTAVSSVDRIDFANDSPTTTSSRAPLNRTHRRDAAAVSNGNYGWFGGGYGPAANNSTIDRVDFANDLVNSQNRGLLNNSKIYSAATGNSNYGWFFGGVNPGSTPQNVRIDRIDYSNDLVLASIRGALPPITAAWQQGSAGNANYGWFAGGYQGVPPATRVASIYRYDYSNDSPTSASPRGSLSLARTLLAGTGNANYGWFAGGNTPAAPINKSTVDRIDYSNDTGTASIRGPLTAAKGWVTATGNANYGWWFGGAVGSAISNIDRIDFANDSPTAATARGFLSSARYRTAGAVSNYVGPSIGQIKLAEPFIGGRTDGTYGWWAGGTDGTNSLSTIDRVDFANDSPTASSPRGILTQVRTAIGSASNSNYGWYAGGTLPAPSSSRVDRIDFANDSPTSASIRGGLSVARFGLAGIGTANYGWFGGGKPSAAGGTSVVDRVDFANDSPTTASVRGPLTSTRYSLSGTSNANYGWWAGGMTSITAITTVNRHDFANDTITVSTRGPLTSAAYIMGSAGNQNYGWFGGGYTTVPIATVQRIDFANDSPTSASTRTSLPAARQNLSAAGTSAYGWWAGGQRNTPTLYYSIVTRIDFASDTTLTARGNISTRTAGAATSNYVKSPPQINIPTYYKGSGSVGTQGPQIDSLSLTQSYPYNTIGTYGWFGGGIAPPVAASLGTIDRIDFSNDSPTAATVRGALTTTRVNLSAVSNTNYGWWGGGYTVPLAYLSSVERIDFSNDSPTSASPRGPLAVISVSGAATGNANYGWWAGGITPTVTSNVQRINYANDSPTSADLRNPLDTNLNGAGAVSNSNYGWFGGGSTVNTPSSPISSIRRIDFSNDSSCRVRGSLSAVKIAPSHAGNSNYGWFMGSIVPASCTSTVERIDYSNDLVSTSIRGTLPAVTGSGGGTGNSNYGWNGGGGATAVVTVYRIDYSNDSPTAASTRGGLSQARIHLRAVSNYVR